MKKLRLKRVLSMLFAIVMVWGTVQMPTNAANEWLDTNTLDEYDYAFALVPDTQTLSWSYPDKMAGIYDWLVENAEEKKIEFVFGLGDITERTKDWEWKFAKEQISKLDGVVPYSVIRGNHDNSKKFNDYFPYEDYADQLGGSFDGLMNNTWREFVVGDVKYLFLTLDYGPSDEVLEWAGQVVSDHPDHNVIVTTHAYYTVSGELITDETTPTPMTYDGGKNNADAIWNQFLKKYENIVMLICGHSATNYVLTKQSEGDNGNIVTQMLVDAQGMDVHRCGTAMVALLYFSEGGSKVQVEYYSTDRNQYFLEDNQYTFELAVVEEGSIDNSSGGKNASNDVNSDVEADEESYSGVVVGGKEEVSDNSESGGSIESDEDGTKEDSVNTEKPDTGDNNKISVFLCAAFASLVIVIIVMKKKIYSRISR